MINNFFEKYVAASEESTRALQELVRALAEFAKLDIFLIPLWLKQFVLAVVVVGITIVLGG